MAENEVVKMPPPERAAKTALGTSTIGSYLKADALLKADIPKGKTLDFGSGKGLGAKAIGADTYEPYVKSKPIYNQTKQIKSNSYDKVTSLNVLNTIEPKGREQAVKNIGRVLKPNGIAIISTRGKDVEDAKIKTKAKDGYIIGKGDQARFQKGFTQEELKDYMQKTLGKNYKVENVGGLGKASVKVTKLKATPTPIYKALSIKGASFPMGKLTKRFNKGGSMENNIDIIEAEKPKYDFSNENLINLPKNVLEGYLTEKYGVDRYVRERSSVFDEVSKNKISDRESILTGPELEALSIAFEEQMKKQQGKKKGGMPKQMEMFEDGGLKDEGGEVDEESGNEVPPGSTKEEVRDDIPARLSEGEFVFPADVVRYLGLDFLMKLRQRAKAGLQKMEEMGQMGNSDEATLPDDIPFTIDDLDMEDDPLEMQVGGVVTNPMGNPTAMPNQVTTMNTPNIYNPNMGQMYTPGGVTPYAPATFKSLLPQSSTGQVKTINKRYVNKATGQVRMIPHVEGTNKPLYPIPEGFVLEETPTEEKKPTPKTETTKVKPVDTGGDDSGSAKVSSATLSIGGDKDPNRPGLQTGATTFDLRYNVPGSLPGIASIASLPGIIGGKAPKGTTVDMTKGNITKTVSFEDFMKIKNDVTGQFAKDFVKNINNLDKLNKNTIAFDSVKNTYVDKTTNEEVDYDTVTKLGEDIADRLEKKTKDKSFLGFDVSTSATDAYNELSDSEKAAYSDYVTEQQEQEETEDKTTTVAAPTDISQIGQDLADDTPDDDAPDDSPSDSMDAAAAGGADSFGLFKQGGLLKRKPKVKKMKRGGLASR